MNIYIKAEIEVFNDGSIFVVYTLDLEPITLEGHQAYDSWAIFLADNVIDHIDEITRVFHSAL